VLRAEAAAAAIASMVNELRRALNFIKEILIYFFNFLNRFENLKKNCVFVI
jgi:hypothetical protein